VVSQKPPVVTQPNPQTAPGKTPAIVKDTADQKLGKPKVVDGSKLSKQDFRALPDNAVILVPGGKQVTKQELLDEAKAKLAQLKSNPPKTAQSLASLRAQFEKKQHDDLVARNAKVTAEIARYKTKEQAMLQSTSYQAIQSEASNLHLQYQKASPAEKQKIENRARELQKQLEDLKSRNLR
jgi:hypothetical protein